MDHRWDERLWQDREGRAERERYGGSRIERDDDVERRDRLAQGRRPVDFSPWGIGRAHWDQRDLYTRDARIEDAGYGRGPAVHPEVGSYAYHRRAAEPVGPGPRDVEREAAASLYEREAWPWLNYHGADIGTDRPPLWWRMKQRLLGRTASRTVFELRHTGKGPKNWRVPDARIHEDACEGLAYAGELDASDIDVRVERGEVSLEGTVRDRHEKRLAEHIVEGVRGVVDVHNHLRVRRDDDTHEQGASVLMPSRAFA